MTTPLPSMDEAVDLVDEDEFVRFYNEFMMKYFPREDERTSLEDMLDEFKWNISHQHVEPESKFKCKEAIAVIFDKKSSFRAGVVYDYFPVSNCGLITHIAVEECARGQGVAHKLLNYAVTKIKQLSQHHGFVSMKEIFAETHKCHIRSSVMDTAASHEALYKLAFRPVKFPYVQPALGEGLAPCHDLILLVHRPDMPHPNYQVEDGVPEGRVNTAVMKSFLDEFYEVCSGGESMEMYSSCGWYNKMMQLLSEQEHLSVSSNLPWTDSEQGFGSDNQVFVVGAGVAGLCAAGTLSKAGENVVLLEAANYLGGRVKQFQPDPEFAPIDMGGELVHGSRTVINQLIKENNWPYEEVYDWGASEGDLSLQIYYRGKFYSFSSEECPDVSRGLRDAYYVLWEYGKKQLALKERGESFEDKSALNVLTEHGFSSDEMSVFKALYCQYEAADLDTLGAMGVASEDNHDVGTENYRLKDSYAILVKHLLSECETVDKRLNWQVTKVDWQDDIKEENKWSVSITNSRGETLTGKAAIITVPLPVLKDEDIAFTPPLPEDKQQVIKLTQMLGGFKVTCRFREAFWTEGTQIIIAVEEFIPQFWIYTRESCKEQGRFCHLVTGFHVADLALAKAGMTSDEIAKKFVEQLDRLFGSATSRKPATDAFMDYVYFNWTDHPYVRGAYSSPSVGVWDEQRNTLAKPVGNLVFGGEHTHGYGSTVYAAMDSGHIAAKHLLKKLALQTAVSS